MLEKLSKSLKMRPFEFIRKSSVKNLFSFLQHERPQTIALVLSYADADQAATVISELPKEKRIKVVECGKDGERFSGCDQDRGIHVEETV